MFGPRWMKWETACRFSTCFVKSFLFLETDFVDILVSVPQCYLFRRRTFFACFKSVIKLSKGFKKWSCFRTDRFKLKHELQKWYLVSTTSMKAKCNHWQQPFLISRKLTWQNSMKNGRICIRTAKLKKKLQTERKCLISSAVLVLLYFNGFSGWPFWFSLQMFCLNNKIHFSLANASNSASFKRKMVWKWRLAHSQTTNKLVNEAANDSARVRGQDRKILPALGTNQIAGFGGFRLLASLEKNNITYFMIFGTQMNIAKKPMSTSHRHAGWLYEGRRLLKKKIDHRQNTKLFFGVYQLFTKVLIHFITTMYKENHSDC